MAGSALLLLLASFVLLSLVVVALARSATGAVVCGVVALLLLLLALRLLRVGVWVSSQGLRQVGLVRTRTLAWRRVADVRTVQQPVRWLALPRTVQGQALVVRTTAGEQLPPLLTDHNADFLGQPDSFGRASDVIEAWAEESGPGSRG
ncbi:PH domain-containing protein [Streptomyces sp. NPDC059740]|uniref:PH domain-containing protein n=1 Tax=Streptomyces sp. NPDC059740 TaxID=3346926 RepID=UPI00365D5DA4